MLDTAISGSMLVVGGSASFILALSWGGIRFAWSDAQTLAPLILGISALLGFILFEKLFAREPLVISKTLPSVEQYFLTHVHRYRGLSLPRQQQSWGMSFSHSSPHPAVYNCTLQIHRDLHPWPRHVCRDLYVHLIFLCSVTWLITIRVRRLSSRLYGSSQTLFAGPCRRILPRLHHVHHTGCHGVRSLCHAIQAIPPPKLARLDIHYCRVWCYSRFEGRQQQGGYC